VDRVLAQRLAADGVLSLADLPDLRHAIRSAYRAGRLVRIHRGVYAGRPPSTAPVPAMIRWRAALVYLGEPAVLSHLTALAVWGLRDAPSGEPVHLTVPPGLRRLGDGGLVVHRRSLESTVVRRGLPITRLERSIVDSWPLLPAFERRRPAIEAIAARRTTVSRLRSALASTPRLPGRGDLVRLLDLLAAGCLSPLEIWGLLHVFSGEGMPAFARQVRVTIGCRVVYLDVYAPIERVDFELDGAASHAGPADRERDVRRDAALASIGILVVRFTYRRLVHEPAAVRDEVRAILAARRQAAA
jgi:very-short-patch-repair endonuclease